MADTSSVTSMIWVVVVFYLSLLWGLASLSAKGAATLFRIGAQTLKKSADIVRHGPTALSLYLQHPSLRQCSKMQLIMIARWTGTNQEEDPFLILRPNPAGVSQPPAGLGPDPEAAVRTALQAAGAIPVGHCEDWCFRFNGFNALLVVRHMHPMQGMRA